MYEDCTTYLWMVRQRRIFNPLNPSPSNGHSCGAGFLVRWLSENKVRVGIPVLLLDTSWNRDSVSLLITRVMSWNEIVEDIKALQE